MRTMKVQVFIRAVCFILLAACLIDVLPSYAQSSAGQWGWCPAPVQAPSTAAPAEPPAGPKVLAKLAENVYFFRSPSTENTLIVVGEHGVLITDTHDDAAARLLKGEIAKITNKPVAKIVLSHEHFDHIGGTRQFPGAEIIAQKNILPFLINDPLHRGPAKIDTTFDTDLTIDMGTTQVELKYFGPTEGIANIVTYLPKERIALVTDLYLADKHVLGFLTLSATNMVGLRRALNEVLKWNPKYVLDAHSSNSDPQTLRSYAGFINDLYDAVFPVVQRENATAGSGQLWNDVEIKLPQSIRLPKYKDWADYDANISANVLFMASSILYNGL